MSSSDIPHGEGFWAGVLCGSRGICDESAQPTTAGDVGWRIGIIAGVVRDMASGGPPEFEPRIPGNPFRGPNAPEQAFKHLEKYSGLDPKVASNRLHKLKDAGGLGPADDVIIGRTGDVYNPITGERLGSLTDKSLGGFKR